MKREIKWMTMALCMSLAPALGAAELKIGYVDAVGLLKNMPQADSAMKKLNQELGAKQDKLIAQQKEIKRLEEELVKEGPVMSQAQRRDKERDLQNLARELRREQEDFRDDLAIRRNEILGRAQEQLQKTIEEVAAAESYDLVIYDSVAFASNRVDITDKVLARLKSGAGAAGKSSESKK